MTGKNQRFHLLYKNVVASFFIKGYAALIALMLVPLTIDCLGTLKNGVWLTISSVLVWINQMDIGLGNDYETDWLSMWHTKRWRLQEKLSAQHLPC